MRTEHDLDRSAAHAILCEVYPPFGRMSLDEGGELISQFIHHWLRADETDMYVFGLRWALQRAERLGWPILAHDREVTILEWHPERSGRAADRYSDRAWQAMVWARFTADGDLSAGGWISVRSLSIGGGDA